LSLRDQLRNSLQKDSKQGKRGTWHSKAYHRFFEGYSEITVPEPNGKGYRIQRIYTGNYYRQDLMKGRRILLRVLYVALFLGAVYLFVSNAILPLASNSTWYVVLTQAASIPFLFWTLIALFSYLPAERDMTINTYRSSSSSLKRATFGSAISLGVLALATLAFMFLNPQDRSLGQLLCGGLLTILINRIESKVNYLIVPSQNKLPLDNNLQAE
jgi:hypothetical protein